MEIQNHQTLLLNKNWLAIDVIPVFDAICKVFQDRANIVDSNYIQYDWNAWVQNWSDLSRMKEDSGNETPMIPGIGFSVGVPEIIVLKEFKGYFIRQPRFSRKSLVFRDNFTCQYCGKKLRDSEITLDHILPKSRGGKTAWKNLVVACVACNSYKADLTPAEAGMSLIREPFKPNLFQRKIRPDRMPKSWQDFIDKAYWNTTLID